MKQIFKRVFRQDNTLQDSVDVARPIETQYKDYSENDYGKHPRFTDDVYRDDLTSWQVPAILEHFNSLEGKTFIDIGAGDIVLGEKLDDIGRPEKFYVQDLSRPSIESGLKRLSDKGINTSNIIPLISDVFDFSMVEDSTVDCAFSNSLFSHLTLNSIILCLRNLRPKMKQGAKYMSSMIVVSGDVEPLSYDWSYMNKKGSEIISYPIRDPYHYTKHSVYTISQMNTGFQVAHIHNYGHPFQKLVEFQAV